MNDCRRCGFSQVSAISEAHNARRTKSRVGWLSFIRRLRGLASQGMAILVASSELDEILALCDRVVVMHRGQLATMLDAKQATRSAILRAAMGEP